MQSQERSSGTVLLTRSVIGRPVRVDVDKHDRLAYALFWEGRKIGSRELVIVGVSIHESEHDAHTFYKPFFKNKPKLNGIEDEKISSFQGGKVFEARMTTEMRDTIREAVGKGRFFTEMPPYVVIVDAEGRKLKIS